MVFDHFESYMIPFGLTFRRGGQASLLCGLATLRANYFLFTLAKTQRRKGIVVHLSSAAADSCLPAGGLCGLASLRAIFFFLFSQSRRDTKKLWSARFDFPPRRTGLAALLENLPQKKELHRCNSFNSIEPLAGIEPATYWLQVSCSTSWAKEAYLYGGANIEGMAYSSKSTSTIF